MSSKIAIFIPDLSGGGAERAMINLVVEFAKRGIFIDLIVIESKGDYKNSLPKEIRLVSLMPKFFKYLPLSQLRLLRSLIKYIVTFLILVKYIKKRNIQILLTTLDISNIIGLITKRYFVKNIILVTRLANILSRQASTSKNWKIRLLRTCPKIT